MFAFVGDPLKTCLVRGGMDDALESYDYLVATLHRIQFLPGNIKLDPVTVPSYIFHLIIIHYHPLLWGKGGCFTCRETHLKSFGLSLVEVMPLRIKLNMKIVAMNTQTHGFIFQQINDE